MSGGEAVWAEGRVQRREGRDRAIWTHHVDLRAEGVAHPLEDRH